MNNTPGTGKSLTENAAAQAAAQIVQATGVVRHDVAVILGSGWTDAVVALGEVVAEVPASDIVGFFAPVLAGHSGSLSSVRLACGAHILVIGARTHLYQGHGPESVAHGIRVAHAAGVRVAILTNGAGSMVPEWTPGTVVMIKDHINLTGHSPLRGGHFCDMSDVYTAELRQKVLQLIPGISQGVYVQLSGPQYETPAEIKMLRMLGGDLVGMSTVLEAIMARALGMQVVGLSLVTNFAAGMTTGPLSHDEVIAISTQVRQNTADLLVRVVRGIARDLPA